MIVVFKIWPIVKFYFFARHCLSISPNKIPQRLYLANV